MNAIYNEYKANNDGLEGAIEALADQIEAYEAGEDVYFGWGYGGIEAASEALDMLEAEFDEEIMREDYEYDLAVARGRYDRAWLKRELVEGYEVQAIADFDLDDYSAANTERLAAAILDAKHSAGEVGTVAAYLRAAYEAEAASVACMASLERVFAGKAVA